MKTQHLFDEYDEFVNNQTQNIANLEQERNNLRKENDQNQQEYKQLVANGEDDEADKLYSTIANNDDKIKAMTKRLNMKKEVSQEARDRKTVELIKHQAELPYLYNDEKQDVLNKLQDVVEEYNALMDKVNDINARYRDEYHEFALLYNAEDIREKESLKRELKPYFSEGYYSNYINKLEDLPFINMKNNKLQFKKGV
ncbi:pathogenicity island protein [Staphylococcus sp. Marseille-Q6910]|uniref:pathogenicity island protein n=1 Tax=Staphylococcus sp. Marseille-Q6910 TaxID=2937990 RepID=UPI00203D1051|nr:pathogenicity island protein [Staphylococcus sp. Marseille-Q6910]